MRRNGPQSDFGANLSKADFSSKWIAGRRGYGTLASADREDAIKLTQSRHIQDAEASAISRCLSFASPVLRCWQESTVGLNHLLPGFLHITGKVQRIDSRPFLFPELVAFRPFEKDEFHSLIHEPRHERQMTEAVPQVCFLSRVSAPILNMSKRLSDVHELRAQVAPKLPQHRRKLIQGFHSHGRL